MKQWNIAVAIPVNVSLCLLYMWHNYITCIVTRVQMNLDYQGSNIHYLKSHDVLCYNGRTHTKNCLVMFLNETNLFNWLYRLIIMWMLFVASGWKHIHTHTYTHRHTDFTDKSNFKKPVHTWFKKEKVVAKTWKRLWWKRCEIKMWHKPWLPLLILHFSSHLFFRSWFTAS